MPRANRLPVTKPSREGDLLPVAAPQFDAEPLVRLIDRSLVKPTGYRTIDFEARGLLRKGDENAWGDLFGQPTLAELTEGRRERELRVETNDSRERLFGSRRRELGK